MTTTLYRGGRVLTPTMPGATALVVADRTVAWVGREESVDAADVGAFVDLDGGVVTPAFVDAHAHATQTGLTLTGVDLHGVTSAADLLVRVAACDDDVVIGTGWDDTRWPDRTLPGLTGDRLVYLARVDVHSAIASPALLAKAGVVADPDGLVREEAHHAVRRIALASLTADQIERAQRAALDAAAARGIGCVHEMSGPEVAGEADLVSLLGISDSVEVVAYWGALGDVETPSRLGVRGAGGDLFCDGSVGSRTAALHAPYADAPGRPGDRGRLFHDAAAVADHVVLAVRAGLATGFHVIGDRAVDAVLDGYELAARKVPLRAGRHRLEHVELATPQAVERMAALGLIASVQPAFDHEWGGPGGMYAERLGADRAAGMNPYAAMAAAGIVLAFGSDSPVTPFDPWGGVRAAVEHRTPPSAISARAAFAAATRGGWRAAGEDDGGVLAAGAPASFAVWDPGSCDPALWDAVGDAYAFALPPGTPVCLRTVVRGREIWRRA